MKKFVNALTLARIIATIIIPILWIHLKPFELFIFVAFILLTDFFDGMLARSFHVQSIFGSIMDAVADKVFGIMIILIVASYKKIFYIPFILEIAISLINLIPFFYGATTKSSFLGRVKMWFLGIALGAGILFVFKSDLLFLNQYKVVAFLLKNIELITLISVCVASGTEIMVAIDYAHRVTKELKGHKHKLHFKLKSDKELKLALFDTDYYLKHKDEAYSKSIFKN